MPLENRKCSGFAEYFVWVCRFWGIATAIGLWGIGMEVLSYGHPIGIYLIMAAISLSLLESVFILNLFVTLVISDVNGCCDKCWIVLQWLDNWKRGLLYFILAVPCFVRPQQAWLAIISGVMLVFSSVFYSIKTFTANPQTSESRPEPHETYNRFEAVGEEDVFNEDFDGNDQTPLQLNRGESVAEQDEILEV